MMYGVGDPPDSPGMAHAHSGGHGGGTTNTNTTVLCRAGVTLIFCLAPGPAVPAAGGSSFASGMVSSADFQLGPQNAPVDNAPGGFVNAMGDGYVRVARVS